MPTFREYYDELALLLGGLDAELDPKRQQAELAEAMAPFQPGGQWYYAPPSARLGSQHRVQERQRKRAGQALASLTMWIRDHMGEIDEAVRRARRAPTAVEVAEQDGRHDPMLVNIYGELLRGRLEPRVRGARPAARLALYTSADATTPEGAATIALIEELHAEGASGPATTDARELAAAQALKQRIDAAQDGRIQKDGRALVELLADARKEITKAEQVHKIRPVRPEPDAEAS